MKKLFFLLLFVPVLVSGQTKEFPLPLDENGKVRFSEVVKVDSVGSKILYGYAKLWIADIFKSAKDVIQLDDSENGRLVAKGFQDIGIETAFGLANVQMWFSLSISIKDNRYKVEVYDLGYKAYPNEYNRNPTIVPAEEMFAPKVYYKNNGEPRALNLKYKNATEKAVEELKKSSQKAMTTKSSKDDW